jgi:hypothetical protein
MIQEIKLNAAIKNGISLDCMIETGVRGGKKKFWRRSDRRGFLCAYWSPTQAAAAI